MLDCWVAAVCAQVGADVEIGAQHHGMGLAQSERHQRAWVASLHRVHQGKETLAHCEETQGMQERNSGPDWDALEVLTVGQVSWQQLPHSAQNYTPLVSMSCLTGVRVAALPF